MYSRCLPFLIEVNLDLAILPKAATDIFFPSCFLSRTALGTRVDFSSVSRMKVLTLSSPLVVKASETDVVPKSIAAILPSVTR